MHRYLDERAEEIEVLNEVVSLATFVPDGQEAKLGLIQETKRRLDAKYGLLSEDQRVDAYAVYQNAWI